ncbi:hypothetical protein Hanom_Chr06g00497211 [Helianthus anomalus]
MLHLFYLMPRNRCHFIFRYTSIYILFFIHHRHLFFITDQFTKLPHCSLLLIIIIIIIGHHKTSSTPTFPTSFQHNPVITPMLSKAQKARA